MTSLFYIHVYPGIEKKICAPAGVRISNPCISAPASRQIVTIKLLTFPHLPLAQLSALLFFTCQPANTERKRSFWVDGEILQTVQNEILESFDVFIRLESVLRESCGREEMVKKILIFW